MTAETLRVVSYNLLHGINLAARGSVDLTATADVLATLDADVIALQEVDRWLSRSGGDDQVAELAGALGLTGVFCAALLGNPDESWRSADIDDGGPAYGVGLLTRRPVVSWHRVRLPGGGAGHRRPGASPRNPGWDREPRVALTATVAGAYDRPLTVVATHLSYLPLRALRQLRVAAGIGAGTGDRMIVGDLNLPAFAVRAAVPGLRHAGGQPTFPAWRPRLQMHHALVDGQLDVRHAVAHPRTTSDHRPLVVDVRHGR